MSLHHVVWLCAPLSMKPRARYDIVSPKGYMNFAGQDQVYVINAHLQTWIPGDVQRWSIGCCRGRVLCTATFAASSAHARMWHAQYMMPPSHHARCTKKGYWGQPLVACLQP